MYGKTFCIWQNIIASFILSQGQGWNIAELAFSQLIDNPSVAPQHVIFFVTYEWAHLARVFMQSKSV